MLGLPLILPLKSEPIAAYSDRVSLARVTLFCEKIYIKIPYGLLLIGNSHYVRIFLVIGLLPFNCAYYTTNKNIKTYLFAKIRGFF